MCQKKLKDVSYQLLYEFFKKYFVVNEWSAVKNSFSTYLWSKVDSCFCEFLYFGFMILARSVCFYNLNVCIQCFYDLQISQYDCNYDNLAPDGCTQYFYGGTMNDVKSYNYDGGQHLAQQNQNICVRRERNYCEICWSEVGTMDFQLTEG